MNCGRCGQYKRYVTDNCGCKSATVSDSPELPSCIAGAYVCEHQDDNKNGVLVAGNTVTYYERHEARKMFAELQTVVNKWDAE